MGIYIELNATDPAPPSGAQNVHFRTDSSHLGTEDDPVPTTAFLSPFAGDSGSGGASGLVPAPAAGDAAAGKMLHANGSFEVPPGKTGIVTLVIDGQGTVISTGAKKRFGQVDYAGTIIGWSLTADQPGSISVDVWKTASSAPPSGPAIPTSSNKISASAPPALASAQSAAGAASQVSTWTTAVAAWDVFSFSVSSAISVTAISLKILIQRT